MKILTKTLSLVALLLASCTNGELYKDSSQPIDKRVENLLSQMTFEEKVEQMNILLYGRNTNENNLESRGTLDLSPLTGGYIYFSESVKHANNIQRFILDESRLGIPAIMGHDVIHGVKTIFPIPLAQACSWNPDLTYQSSRVAAQESYTSAIRWTFSPMIDVARDFRWGRVAESYGEDSYVNSVFGVAAVKGYQGENLADENAIAACLKHFAGYAYSQGGRDYRPTDISDLSMWECVFPPYKACVEAGAATVMNSFNDLNGVPTVANAEICRDILKGKWGFEGFIVSDWFAVDQLVNQRYAKDEMDAGLKALEGGTDMDMYDGIYVKHFEKARELGLIDMEKVDDAVRRILKVKFQLGLFENPYSEDIPTEERYLLPESVALAEKSAEESMVLLKNSGVLPLAASVKNIMLVGVMAQDSVHMMGTWRCYGDSADVVSVEEGLRQEFGSKATINYVAGAALKNNSSSLFPAMKRAAQSADVIVVALGEDIKWSGENGSKSTLALPEAQEQIVIEAKKSGKPVVLLLSSGRPLELCRVEPYADAIIEMWQPGTCGGSAVAGIISGRVNPSGRLAITFPYSTGQTPIYYNQREPARTGTEGDYVDITTDPMYEFGHGLSYSTFEYGAVKLSKSEITKGETLVASVEVTNSSEVDGAETLLWFVDDPVASITQPAKKLKHFEKAEIKAGETREFIFEIDPARDLSFVNDKGKMRLEAGDFGIIVKDQRAAFVLK
ncbi:MAG: glycoside hydrolase family 3 N-terminal domain-containing protein [Rikenellaceae bacterium]